MVSASAHLHDGQGEHYKGTVVVMLSGWEGLALVATVNCLLTDRHTDSPPVWLAGFVYRQL